MAEKFSPSFRMVRGGLHGYDQTTDAVTERNLKALVNELFDFERLQLEGATESWQALWDHIHYDEAFWWKYYCGRECRVEIKEGWEERAA